MSRSKVLQIRLTTTEYAMLQRLARRRGQNLSAIARERIVPKPDEEDQPDAVRVVDRYADQRVPGSCTRCFADPEFQKPWTVEEYDRFRRRCEINAESIWLCDGIDIGPFPTDHYHPGGCGHVHCTSCGNQVP